MARMVTFQFSGGDAMAAKIRKIAYQTPRKVKDALYIEAEFIMTRSKQNFVPVNYAALKDSGGVPRHGGSKMSQQVIQVTMVYGGASAPYAEAIHEHPSAASPPSWRGKSVGEIVGIRTGQAWTDTGQGRGPKYLERPMMQAIPGMDGRIAKYLEVV